jgi:spore coat protein CotH
MKIYRKISYVIVFTCSIILGSCANKIDTLDEGLSEISIACNQEEFNHAYLNYEQNILLSCTVVYKGKTYKGVKMRVRGDTSREKPKKSLKLKFPKNALFLDSLEAINLNAEYSDKSLIRQKLSSDMFAHVGLPCFQSQFVQVNMNNQFFGLYLKVENIDDHFAKRVNLNSKSNLYKATKDGACLSEFDDVHVKWEKKAGKDSSFFDLEQLITRINETPTENFRQFLEKHFEYKKLIKVLAMNMFIANGSTYYHNYYMYHNTKGNGKWQMLPWDMDKTLSYYSWKPYLYHETSSDWESDNPLVEKAILNADVKKDLVKAIEYLGTMFTDEWVRARVSYYSEMLEPFVLQDSTNQIGDINKWKQQLLKEENFVIQRSALLIKQIDQLPASFELVKTPPLCLPEVLFRWHKSENCKSYKLYVSKDFLFKKAGTKIIETSDTSLLVTALDHGKHYWKVVAENKHGTTTGFNSKNIFVVKKHQQFPKTLTNDLSIGEKDFYVISETAKIPSNVTVTIYAGATIYFEQNAKLLVNGRLIVQGKEHHKVTFKPASNASYWHSIFAEGAKSFSINHACFSDGLLNIKNTEANISNTTFLIKHRQMVFGNKRPSIIWTNKSDITIDHIDMIGNGFGEGMNFNYGKISVTNSRFTKVPDAIEFININGGVIKNNTVMSCLDDAIDMNGCSNIEVAYNSLMYSADKGVSVGTEQYGKSIDINIHHNLIVGNGIGVSVKDSSSAIVSYNTFFKNGISVQAYQKRTGYLKGGNITLSNNIIEKSTKEAVKIDELSELKSDNNIGYKLDIQGNKSSTNPGFKNASELDFRTKVKQGAFQKDQPLVTMSSICYSCKEAGDYIQLQSNTSVPIQLTKWTLEVNGKSQKIQPINLLPFQRVYFAKDPSEFYSKFGVYPEAFLADNLKKVKEIKLIDSKGVIHDSWKSLDKDAKGEILRK